MSVNRVNDYSNSYVISLPFQFSFGGVTKVVDDSDMSWRHRVLTILNTNEFERVFNRYFGASLQGFAFQPESEVAIEVPSAISEAFVRWLPKLKLVEVSTNYDEIDGGLVFNILYKLPSGTTDSVKITYADLTRAGETVKVNI